MISLIESVFDLASTIALEAGSLKEEAKTDPTNGRAATRIEVKTHDSNSSMETVRQMCFEIKAELWWVNYDG